MRVCMCRCACVCVCKCVCVRMYISFCNLRDKKAQFNAFNPPLNLLDMLKSCRLKAVESLLFTEPPLSIPFSSDAGNTGFPVLMGRGEKIWLS